MTVSELLQILDRHQPVSFQQVLDAIAAEYDYQPTGFANGMGNDRVVNAAGENEGSCKVLYFARLHGLSEAATLRLFGEHYAEVLHASDTSRHRNIRAFMRHGWQGVHFEGEALIRKGRATGASNAPR